MEGMEKKSSQKNIFEYTLHTELYFYSLEKRKDGLLQVLVNF